MPVQQHQFSTNCEKVYKKDKCNSSKDDVADNSHILMRLIFPALIIVPVCVCLAIFAASKSMFLLAIPLEMILAGTSLFCFFRYVFVSSKLKYETTVEFKENNIFVKKECKKFNRVHQYDTPYGDIRKVKYDPIHSWFFFECAGKQKMSFQIERAVADQIIYMLRNIPAISKDSIPEQKGSAASAATAIVNQENPTADTARENTSSFFVMDGDTFTYRFRHEPVQSLNLKKIAPWIRSLSLFVIAFTVYRYLNPTVNDITISKSVIIYMCIQNLFIINLAASLISKLPSKEELVANAILSVTKEKATIEYNYLVPVSNEMPRFTRFCLNNRVEKREMKMEKLTNILIWNKKDFPLISLRGKTSSNQGKTKMYPTREYKKGHSFRSREPLTIIMSKDKANDLCDFIEIQCGVVPTRNE